MKIPRRRAYQPQSRQTETSRTSCRHGWKINTQQKGSVALNFVQYYKNATCHRALRTDCNGGFAWNIFQTFNRAALGAIQSEDELLKLLSATVTRGVEIEIENAATREQQNALDRWQKGWPAKVSSDRQAEAFLPQSKKKIVPSLPRKTGGTVRAYTESQFGCSRASLRNLQEMYSIVLLRNPTVTLNLPKVAKVPAYNGRKRKWRDRWNWSGLR